MKKFGKLIALILTLGVLLSLAACGDKSSGSSGGKKEEHPDFVYTASFGKVWDDGGNRPSIRNSVFTEDGLYYVTNEVVGQRPIPDGYVQQYEGEFDVYGPVLYKCDLEGNKKKIDAFTSNAPEIQEGHQGGSNVGMIAMSPNGELVIIENVYDNWSDAPEGTEMYSDAWYQYYIWTNDYYLHIISPDGAETVNVQIDTSASEEEYFDLYSMDVAADGTIICSGGMYYFSLNRDGSMGFMKQEDNYAESIKTIADGRTGYITYGENGMSFVVIDTATGAKQETLPMEGNIYNSVRGTGEYALYYIDGMNLKGYNIEKDQEDVIVNFVNCDINPNDVGTFTVKEDGTIVGLTSEYTNNSNVTQSFTLTSTPYDQVPHKETLSLATMYMDDLILQNVIKFNRTSNDYRIEVKDYSEYNDYNVDDGYRLGAQKLLTEIMAGEVPDILQLDQLPAQQLAAKGILADLYEFMDKDGEMSREDFFPNVLKAFEYDGKLYSTCSAFSIRTVAGASSVVGDTPGWTYRQLMDALHTMPDGCEAFDVGTTREQVLINCLNADLDNYVDWSTGKCSFDSQEFVDLLTFAASFPESFDWEHYEWSEDSDAWNRIASGQQMLMEAGLYDFGSIMQYDGAFGGKCTFIGYPTSKGNGSIIAPSNGFGISAKSAHKDACWQFLRVLFTEEFQDSSYYGGFPTNRKLFDKKLQETMTEQYLTDENGNYMLDMNGERVKIEISWVRTDSGDYEPVYALSRDQADRITAVIESTDHALSTNTTISDTVVQEAQAFFAGQKSAQDVANLIQNKVSIYVNEQR